ncbi:hypothetical protein [Micromonospora chersina]
MTSPTSDAASPVEASAAPPPTAPASTEPEPPVVEVKADPMMLQVVHFHELACHHEPAEGTNIFDSHDDH